jgi:hypothetical protein
MTEFRFNCPRCGSREYGTITRGNGSQAYACHGLIQVDRLKGVTRSCDFEIPITGPTPARTVQERELAVEEMKRGAARVQERLASMDVNSPGSAEDVAECFAELEEAARLLAYDARLAEQWAVRELGETKP